MQLGPSEIIKPPATEPAITEQSDASTAGQTSALTTEPQSTTLETQNDVAIVRLFNRLQSGESMLPNALLVGGMLLMVIILMRKLRKNYKSNAKRSNRQLSPSKRIANLHSQAQASMEPAYKVMVDAEEMARRLGATLDNKAARLELLIEESDRKLAELNRALSHSQTTPPPQQQQPQPIQPTNAIDPTLMDRARLEQDLEERQSRVAGRIDPAYQQPTPKPVIEEPKTIQMQVIELAETGHSNIDIAHILKHPIGQVELILNLRKQQG